MKLNETRGMKINENSQKIVGGYLFKQQKSSQKPEK